jgi:hypothetical protein
MTAHNEDHPDSQLLERFMRDEAAAPERRRVVRHLLAGCARCAALTRRLWCFGEEPTQEPPGPAGPAAATTYSGVFQRLAEHAERTLEQHLQGRDLIQQGILHCAGAREGAEPARQTAMAGILLLRQGLALVDERCEPALVALALHRLALLLAEAGQTEAALAALLEARRGFLDEGHGVEAAAVLFDLAMLYTREGRTAEIRQLTEDLVPSLQALDIQQGVALSLVFLRRVAETGHATVEALAAVHGYVAGTASACRPLVNSGW